MNTFKSVLSGCASAFLSGVLASSPGCAGVSDSASLASTHHAVALGTDLSTRVYAATDRNTADFYLTDLPETAPNSRTDLASLTGNLIHVHTFLRPRAGATPIAEDACSFTVRHFVFTGSEIGVYSGGGFVSPRGAIGDETCGGIFRNATLRLTSSTPGFVDRLGPCTLEAAFDATRNDPHSREWAALITRAFAEMK